jgi:cell division protein YceG involved in septum cleavage
LDYEKSINPVGDTRIFLNELFQQSEKSVSISIPTGATGAEIAQILKAAGVVASAESFFRAAVANPKASSIAPGTHSLSLKISGKTALEQLLDPKRITDLIKITEGAWNSEVFATNGGHQELVSQSGSVSKRSGFT